MEQLSDIGFYMMRVLWESKDAMTVPEIKNQQPLLAEKNLSDQIKELIAKGYIRQEQKEDGDKKVKTYQPLLTEKQYAVRLIGSYQKKNAEEE